jgi:hypothetical protein
MTNPCRCGHDAAYHPHGSGPCTVAGCDCTGFQPSLGH